MPNTWGHITWIFFHTIFEQLTEEQFKQHKSIIINHIKTIFSIIPCDFCRTEADTQYKQQVKHWNTKEDIRMFLFHFHNKVNKRLKKEIYSFDKLKVYETYNIKLVCAYFKQYFGNAKQGMKMHLNLQRRQLSDTVSNFYINLLS